MQKSPNKEDEFISNTGKSVEDYRNIIKQLKVKVKKLQQINQELEEKIVSKEGQFGSSSIDPSLIKTDRPKKDYILTQSPQKDDPSFDISSNEMAIYQLFKNAQKLGFTLEMLYRAADAEGKGILFVEDFRIFLTKVKLNLSPAEINKLLHMFDEDWTGTIKKDDFQICLSAYNVNTEKLSQESTRTIGQESILTFVRVLEDKRYINAEEIFKSLDIDKKGSFNSNQFSDFYKRIQNTVSRRERAAAYLYLDMNQKGSVTKSEFIDIMEKAYKVLHEKKGIDYDHSSSNAGNNTAVLRGDNKGKFEKIVEKFEKNNGPFTKLLESLVLNSKTPEEGISFANMDDALNSFGHWSAEEKFLIYRGIDKNGNGCLGFDDLSTIFVEFQRNDSNFMFFIINYAKNLQALNLNTKDKLEEEGIMADNVLNEDEFCVKITGLLNIYKEDAKKLFSCIEKRNKGKIIGAELINIINGYRSDGESSTILKINKDLIDEEDIHEGDQSLSPDLKKTKTSKTLKSENTKIEKEAKTTKIMTKHVQKILDEDDKAFNKYLQILKPNLEDKDFYTFEGKKFETILNDPISCLKKCNDLVKELKSKNSKYEDPEFGPNENDPYGLMSMYFYDNTFIPGCPNPEDIRWLHLDEISQDQEPKFIDEDGFTANEVLQSSFLGNCWFVSSLSLLATHDELLRGNFHPTDENLKEITSDEVISMQKGVYPPMFHFLRNYGIYVFRFFKNYHWKYVIVDDKLPCLQNGDLVYGKCRPPEDSQIPDEFWVSLIEKAYAKMHNCYQALFSGYIDEGLADMTGFASEKRDIIIANLQTDEQKDELWNTLVYFMKNKCMIGCSANGGTEHNISLNGEDTGLKSGHAYAVLNVLEVVDKVNCKNYHKSHRLIRIRNPWGFGEWQLKWSENFENSDKLKNNLNLIQQYFEDLKEKKIEFEEFDPVKEDGTFLMCYKDWRNIFHNLFISLDFPDEWSGRRCNDAWTAENSGGFPMNKSEDENIRYAKNPQYLIKIDNKGDKKTQLFISVGQSDGRLVRGLKYPYKEMVNSFNTCIYKLPQGQSKIEKFDRSKILYHTGKFKISREICIPTSKYDNGSYVVIPSCKDEKKEGNFTLNIYFDCDPKFISFEKIGDKNVVFEEIEEEEEDYQDAPKELKELLKIRGRAIIY